MTYTVYIPDAERGPTSYTQRQFESIKALARWAMDAALEEPAAPVQVRDPAVVELVSQIEKAVLKPGAIIGIGAGDTVEKLKKFMGPPEEVEEVPGKQQTPTIGWLAQEATKATVTPASTGSQWEVDTDEWFADASGSEWAKPLRTRDWTIVAQKYLAEIEQLFDSTLDPKGRDNAISHEDQWWFKQLARSHPQHFAENLFPETQVRWELLPVEFGVACAKELKQKKYTKSCRHVTAAHRFAKDAFTILNFMRAGQRHVSWKDVSVPSQEGLAWGAPAAEATTEKLLTLWWVGEKPTDAVREFVLRAVVMRYFKQTTAAATSVGSAEFLSSYTECVRRMGADGVLPAGFLDWATRGTSFKHCKAALTSLGIASIRRSDGQKYTNLEEIKDVSSESWAFENNLGDANCEAGPAPYSDLWDHLASTSTWASSSLSDLSEPASS